MSVKQRYRFLRKEKFHQYSKIHLVEALDEHDLDKRIEFCPILQNRNQKNHQFKIIFFFLWANQLFLTEMLINRIAGTE